MIDVHDVAGDAARGGALRHGFLDVRIVGCGHHEVHAVEIGRGEVPVDRVDDRAAIEQLINLPARRRTRAYDQATPIGSPPRDLPASPAPKKKNGPAR